MSSFFFFKSISMKLVDDKGVISKEEYKKLNYDEKLNYWQIKEGGFKLISELGSEHLQKAFCYAQTKELIYFNKHNLFNGLAEQIETEAGKRGVSLSDINTKFHRNERKYKSKISEIRKHQSGHKSSKI